MIPDERRNKIVDYLKIKKTLTIPKISEKFNISEITVRRDLNILSKEGDVKKVYGGATILNSFLGENTLFKRIQMYPEEKKKIASEAIKRISEGDTVVIESGSTCIELVNKLSKKSNIRIITAAPHIINKLSDLKRRGKFEGEILCSGGILRGDPDDIFLGPQAISFFNGIKIDIAFFGILAFSLNDGWMAPSIFEAELTRKIISCSKKVIGITVHSKFGKTSFSKIGPISLFDEIITDSGLDKETLKIYQKNVKITLC